MNGNTEAAAVEFDRDYAAEQLRRSQSPWRRLVKGFYLRSMLRELSGPTVDFGCGAGQLLARLPSGSVGIEVNPHLIESLRGAGHQVFAARADISDFELCDLPADRFQSLVIAHVLEHLPDPGLAINVLLAACRRIGIRRVLVVVPGAKGFASDSTHKTFIDSVWLSRLPDDIHGFVRSAPRYFPGPWRWIGRYFVFHETQVVFVQGGDLG